MTFTSFKRWIKDHEAAMATAMAIMLPVITTAVGVSVDLSRAYLVHDRLAHALDSAALAAASSHGDEAYIEQRFNDYFNANYPDGVMGDPFDVDIVQEDLKVNVSAKANVSTTFMKVIGVDYLTVSANAEVSKSVGANVELAMVLDISGSMAGQKLTDLKAAAKSLVNIVVKADQSEYYSKVAIVPYSMAVNVGTYANSVRGSVTSGTCTTPGCTSYKFKNPSGQNVTFAISNCVSERTGSQAYTDAAPTVAYVGRNYPSAQNNPCLGSQIVPLTSNKTTLTNNINNLQATGSTGGQVGVAWGWYLVSPNWGYLFPSASRPAAYGTEDLYKVVVLMTDGEYNSPYCNGVIAKDATSGSGNTADHINCNATNGNAYSQSERMCDAMKAAGIEVYTVGFKVDQYPNGRDLMEYCASDAGHFYDAANGQELLEAFESIAHNVNSIYLSQ